MSVSSAVREGIAAPPKERIENNLEAISTLKKLQEHERSPTSTELETLAKFQGWGALWQVFDWQQRWATDYQAKLRELLSPEEFEAARGSILNAHYTDPDIIDIVWNGIEQLGFKGGRILEPGCGTGYWKTFQPELMQNEWVGVELEPTSTAIASYLHPDATIYNLGFEKVQLSDNHFDLAIGNVPFGSYRLHELRYAALNLPIHCHFLAKAADLVRPGGAIAIVTSTGMLDSAGNVRFCKALSKKLDLISASRLPSSAFKQNARTEVTTDLLIFQKRETAPAKDDEAPDWTTSIDFKIYGSEGAVKVKLSKYYEQEREGLLGKPCLDKLYGDRFGLEEDGNFKAKLAERMQALPHCYEALTSNAIAKELIPSELQHEPTGSFCLWNGTLVRKTQDTIEAVSDYQTERITAAIALHDLLEKLIDKQQTTFSEDEVENARKELRDHYFQYIRKYGYLSDRGNQSVLSGDPRWFKLRSLETVTGRPADILTRSTARPYVPPTHASDATEALLHSLNHRGGADLTWMASLIA